MPLTVRISYNPTVICYHRTKRLRKKAYIDEDITNFRLIESGLDEKNIEKSKRFYELGLYRGAYMILDVIKDEKIKKIKREFISHMTRTRFHLKGN